jgi:nitrite reductase/ring-hydroxylating ferredoxin subunit
MATTPETGVTIVKANALCHLEELEQCASLGFDLDDEGQDQFFVVHINGQVNGWVNACPHVIGSPMAWRRNAYLDASKQWIQCHAHGALFDPSTGLCSEGPCKGKYLKRVGLVVGRNGQVRLDGQPVNF